VAPTRARLQTRTTSQEARSQCAILAPGIVTQTPAGKLEYQNLFQAVSKASTQACSAAEWAQ